MFSTDITTTDARCGPETHVVIDMLKLRYEWSNYKHLRERNEAAGITKEIIDKVRLSSDCLPVIPPLPRLCLPSYSRLSPVTVPRRSWCAPRSHS